MCCREIDRGLPWPFQNQAETSCDSSSAILLAAFPDFVLVYSMSRCFTKCPVLPLLIDTSNIDETTTKT